MKQASRSGAHEEEVSKRLAGSLGSEGQRRAFTYRMRSSEAGGGQAETRRVDKVSGWSVSRTKESAESKTHQCTRFEERLSLRQSVDGVSDCNERGARKAGKRRTCRCKVCQGS
jgi:hypothetical protein